MSLADNWRQVENEIARACERSCRERSAVKMVAATKYVNAEVLRDLYALGGRRFGENRVVDALTKTAMLRDCADIEWHFIGHLQRNKAKKILPDFAWLHSVESAELLDLLNESALPGKKIKILLEVNIGGEDSKYGIAPKNATELARRAVACENLVFVGLMGMAPLTTDNETARPFFRELAELRDHLQQQLGVALPELSMGMSGDFSAAILEGSTIVRIGSRLFR